MNDFSRLEDKLAKLRQRERAQGEPRTLRGTSAEALLGAILTEVDETILPRRLTFTPDSGPVLHLAVANRRLQAILAPAPKDVHDLVNVALKDADDPNAVRLLKALTSTLSGASQLVVTSNRQKDVSFPSDTGIPANILSRAWNVADASDSSLDASEVLSAFLGNLGDRVYAWLQISGEEVVAEHGEEEFLSELAEQAALFLDGYFAKRDLLFPGDPGPCAVAIAPNDDIASGALFLDIGDQSAFIAVSSRNFAGVVGEWQKATLKLS